MAYYFKTNLTVEARGGMSCSFKCIKCGEKGTAYLPIIEIQTSDSNRVYKNAEDRQKIVQEAANARLKRRLDALNNMSLIEKCSQFPSDVKCKKCGENQPWARKSFIRNMAGVGYLVLVFFIIGIIAMIVLLIAGDFYEKELLTAVVPVALTIGSLVFGLAKKKGHEKQINKVIMELQNNPEKEIPSFMVG